MQGKKPKKQPDKGGGSTALVHRRTKIARIQGHSPGQTRKRMKLFLRAYRTSGNISVSCQASGLHRATVHRWLSGLKPLHIWFQNQMAKEDPEGALIDAADAVIKHHLTERSLHAAMFTLKMKGRSRGWTDKPETDAEREEQKLERVARAFQDLLDDHPDLTPDQRELLLQKFAQRGEVSPAALAVRIKL